MMSSPKLAFAKTASPLGIEKEMSSHIALNRDQLGEGVYPDTKATLFLRGKAEEIVAPTGRPVI